VKDLGPLCGEYPHIWAILADKGYQGSAEFLRTIIPKRKPANGLLTRGGEEKNRKISSDRVLVENYLGGSVGFGEYVKGSGSGRGMDVTECSGSAWV